MDGYKKVAQLMGTHGDLMILRRFRSLNAQNLLYLQAELIHLEADLQDLEKRDASQPGREYYQRDWWSLSHGGANVDQENEQWEAVSAIREKLENYNDAVLKQVALRRLESPSSHDLGLLRSWFERPRLGAFPLLGLDRDAWNSDKEELLALKPRPRQDVSSRWFIDKIVPKLHACLGYKVKDPVGGDIGPDMFEYKEATLKKVLDVTTTTIASLLPLCSVVMLYFIQHGPLRIGVIVLLSACFSFALAVMTNARKIEIFAATAAFAAVNVVYLTNNDVCCMDQ